MEGFYILLMRQLSAKFNLMNTVLLESYGIFLHTADALAVCKIQFNEYSIIRIIWKVSTYCQCAGCLQN